MSGAHNPDVAGVGVHKVFALWKSQWGGRVKFPIDDNFRTRFIASPEAQRLALEEYQLARDAVKSSYKLSDAVQWLEGELSTGDRSMWCQHGNPRKKCTQCKTVAQPDRSQPFGSRNINPPPSGGIAPNDY